MSAVHQLAHDLDQALAASWRGDDDARLTFDRWLAPFWRRDAPPSPVEPPVAISHLGGGGRGVRWYETTTTVLGYVSGCPGCYQIPIAALLPSLNLAA